MAEMTSAAVLAFWREAGPKAWFSHDPAFDDRVRGRFAAIHESAAAGGLIAWEDIAEGELALLILLDQMPRNMFRGTPRAFATDAMARGIAARGRAKGFDAAVPAAERTFFYLPLMHSEALVDQEQAVALYAAHDPGSLTYAVTHRDIVRDFGRFPHRNAILGRETTAAEQAFLDGGGFKG